MLRHLARDIKESLVLHIITTLLELFNFSQIAVDIDVETPQPFHITELMKMKAQELRDQARKMEEEEEKKLERHRDGERIRASKDLTEAKRTTEESERKRHLALRNAEKEEEKRARKKILQKLEQDKVERRFGVVLPSERPAALKPSMPFLQGKKDSLPVKSGTKAEHMRECLRSIKRSYLVKHPMDFIALTSYYKVYEP
ncbi:hypothetical protein I3760_04G103800 [Carya illinoinensis]|nr:hypothetical protein I3760_04G103800 [Carya illinoinensis]